MKLIKIFKYIPNQFKENLLYMNYYLNKLFLKNFLPLSSLNIEVTSYCNLGCKGCYRTLYEYDSKNKNMPLQKFKGYVDKSPNFFSLYLHGLGEPTLHPNIQEIVEYSRKSNKFRNIGFTTNALAKNPQIYEKLFSKGLTNLTISVDSLDQKEVNKIRPFTDVQKLMDNIGLLFKKFPKNIKIDMVINNININTFEKTLKKLYDLGLREVSFHPYDDLGYSELKLSSEQYTLFLEKLKKVQLPKMKFHSGGFIPIKTYCKFPSIYPSINAAGYLTPCCRIFNEKIFNAGNLNDKTFNEIFFSKKYRDIQKNIKKKNYPFFCKGCLKNHIESHK